MEHLRQHIPDTLGGLKVIAVEDYQSQKRINKRDDKIETISLPKSNVIRLIFDEDLLHYVLQEQNLNSNSIFHLMLTISNKFRMISINIYLMIINKIEK